MEWCDPFDRRYSEVFGFSNQKQAKMMRSQTDSRGTSHRYKPYILVVRVKGVASPVDAPDVRLKIYDSVPQIFTYSYGV